MAVRAGKLISFDAGAYTALVQMDGSLSVYLDDIPVARNIASGDLIANRRVAVLFVDDSNFTDAVVITVWT